MLTGWRKTPKDRLPQPDEPPPADLQDMSAKLVGRELGVRLKDRLTVDPDAPLLDQPPSLGVRAREAGLGEQARQPDPSLADRGGRDLSVLYIVWDLVLPVHGIETGFG